MLVDLNQNINIALRCDKIWSSIQNSTDSYENFTIDACKPNSLFTKINEFETIEPFEWVSMIKLDQKYSFPYVQF